MSTIQLDFASLDKIYGRDSELDTLKETWQSVEAGSHATVLVYGYAGSGKTTLVRRSLDESSAVVGTGKFDQLRSRQPFAALSMALKDILDSLLTRKDTHTFLQERLEADKVAALFPILPNLSKFVTRSEANQDSSLKAIENGLVYLMRQIPDPVVLFMDDLQFADAATLDLLVALAGDRGCDHVGYVFCYRDHEVDEAHPWAIRLRKLETTVTRIPVKDLPTCSICELLCDLMERQDCEELAAIVYDKTGGNIIYTLQLLAVLQKKSLISYDMRTYQWMWKPDGIRDECTLSENVVDLVVKHLGCLDRETMEVLQVASCLGARFDAKVLTEILSRSLESNLKKAVQERLVIGTRHPFVYKWAHDRIQEAAYLTLEDSSAIHWRIGTMLRPQLSANDVDETTMLAVVDQFNRGRQHMKVEDTVQLVKWNIMAARIAIERSAFFPALEYVSAGIGILGEKGWSADYGSMLLLSTMAVKVQFAVGDNDKCLDQIRCHLLHARNVDDELPVYTVELKARFSYGNVAYSLDRGIEILRRITRLRFPRYPSRVELFWYQRRMKCRLSRLPVKALIGLRDCTNRNTAVAINIIAELSIVARWCGEPNMITFLCMRGIELSLDYGLVSAFPFALYCMVMGSTGDYEMTYEVATLTLELMKRCPLVDQPRSTVCVTLYGVTLRKPLHDQIDRVLSAYNIAMEVGEPHWGVMAGSGFIRLAFFAGFPLESLKEDALSFHREMVKYRQDTLARLIAPYVQVIVNLASPDQGIETVLQGNLIQSAEVYTALPRDNYDFRTFNFVRLISAVHFMDLDLCEEIAESYWCGPKSNDGSLFDASNRRFYYGLVGYALARRNQKHLRRGRRMERELKQLVTFGNVNCTHLLLILQAEETAFGSYPHKKVKGAYDKAISLSARSGFFADAALASQ